MVSGCATFIVVLSEADSLQGNRAGPESARTVKFPDLMRAEHGYGFHSVDRDGIYRAYHADGRVLGK